MEKKTECLFNFYFKSGLVDTDDFNDYLHIVDIAQRDWPDYEAVDAPGALICCLESNDYFRFNGTLQKTLLEIFTEHLNFLKFFDFDWDGNVIGKKIPIRKYKRKLKKELEWETDILLLVDIDSKFIRIMGIGEKR